MDKILFSERLRERRKEKGYISQRAFAKAYDEKFPPKRKDDSNGSDSGFLGTLKNYESGGAKCNPKLEYVVNICKLLDCSVDYLLGEINTPTHELEFVCDFTGLSLESVAILHELTRKNVKIKSVTYKMLNSLLDWLLLEELSIYCEEYRINKFSDRPVCIQNVQGENVTFLHGGDVSFLLAQNKFKDFLEFMSTTGENHDIQSRCAWSKDFRRLSNEDIAELQIEETTGK